MTFQERKRTGAALLCAVLAVFPFFVACGGDTHEAAQDQTVQVRVTDQELAMPGSLPTGATTFEVTNAGSHEHSFGITGPAGDMLLEEPLKPGETATLAMNLEAGTYRVYCPVDESHGKSMQLALHVVPAAGSHG
jgi:Cupredoxin-like domain